MKVITDPSEIMRGKQAPRESSASMSRWQRGFALLRGLNRPKFAELLDGDARALRGGAALPTHQEDSAMPVSKVLLLAEGLRREVGGKIIVREASFALAAGEVVAITGPSGAGKSSLLRLVNRLDAPSAGRIMLAGADTAALDVHELRRRVGMVMQQANLFPGTVAENVGYGPALCGELLKADEVGELLRTVGLAGYAKRDVAGLSGGEAQRVSLARTLANRPQVLLLDEPTSALDDAAKLVVEEALRAAMAQVAGACLIVTHDAAQAARLAQRILQMRGGVLRDQAGGDASGDANV
jgi:putative ABC transport system ATP-binding protein